MEQGVNLVAINDPMVADDYASYMFKYDTGESKHASTIPVRLVFRARKTSVASPICEWSAQHMHPSIGVAVHGPFHGDVFPVEGGLSINGSHVATYSEMDPTKIPWGKHDVDIVIEASGVFTTSEKCQAHLEGGAKRVLITAPAKDKGTPTFVYGVNHESYDPSSMKVSAPPVDLAPLTSRAIPHEQHVR